MPRETHYASQHVQVARLLDLLRDLDAHPGSLSTCVAARAGISRSTLQRLLSSAERDLGVIVGATRNPGGMWIDDWGVLDARRVREFRGLCP